MEMKVLPFRASARDRAAVSPRPATDTKGGRRVPFSSSMVKLMASDWYRSIRSKVKPRR